METDCPNSLPGEVENPAASDMAQSVGMTPVFRTAQMYRTSPSERLTLPLHRWFGITTFELG